MSEKVQIRPYLPVDGREVEPDAARLSRTDSRITIELVAPRDGTCRFGAAMEAQVPDEE